MKKIYYIAAALIVLFMFPLFGFAAYTAEPDEITEDMADDVTEDIADKIADDEITVEPDMEMVDFDDFTAENTTLPTGAATVIDYGTDPEGRLFYTIMTPDEHVFFLVIDTSSADNNVYFLNAVTVDDLVPLAQKPLLTQNIQTTTVSPNTANAPEQPAEPLIPTANGDDSVQKSSNTGMIILVVAIAAAGGVVGWYFKIYRPKQQRLADGDEYSPSADDLESDCFDDWDDDSSETGDRESEGDE